MGAGASRAHPADLPDFAQLVRKIGALVGREPTDDEVRHPDVFLGRLQDNGNDVHQLVANAIDLPGSQPNALHQAIVGLASAYPSPRIVTTNYDLKDEQWWVQELREAGYDPALHQRRPAQRATPE